MAQRRRELALTLVALFASGSGCKTSYDSFPVPVSAAELRSALPDVRAPAHKATVTDKNGDRVRLSGDMVVMRDGEILQGDVGVVSLGNLAETCAANDCPLDAPNARWRVIVPMAYVAPDPGWWAAIIATGAIAAPNVACFATDVCSDSTRTAVIITDVAVGAIGLVMILMLGRAIDRLNR